MKRIVFALVLVLLTAGLAAMGYFTLRGEGQGTGGGSGVGGGVAVGGQGTAQDVTDADFDRFVSSGVVLVDFWAPWCPPCRKQGPIVESLAGRFSGRALVGKLNVDRNPATARKFGVRAIPMLIVFVNGQKFKQFTGLQSESTLSAALEDALGG